jgi:hypothetical protein
MPIKYVESHGDNVWKHTWESKYQSPGSAREEDVSPEEWPDRTAMAVLDRFIELQGA